MLGNRNDSEELACAINSIDYLLWKKWESKLWIILTNNSSNVNV